MSLCTDGETDRARRLILRHGWNATSYQILNPGIALWFSAAADAVVGYVRHRHTLVVAGAPVSELSRLESVAAEFAGYAHSLGCTVCYFGAGERLESLYGANRKWSRVLLGAQPSWDPRRWPDALLRRGSVRAQFNRARNKGVVVREWSPVDAENHPALRRCLSEWLATRHLPPLHFLVEPETLSRLQDRRVFVAERGDREVLAFTVLSPVPARNGWLVEQIVRGVRAPNGTAELLIDTAMRAVAGSDAGYATLGLSPLSDRAGVILDQRLWLRLVLKWVRLHGARFYNFAGLDSFKAKFNPDTWEPIYAIAEGSHFSPRALYAIAGAFSGGAPTRLVLAALARAAERELRSLWERIRARRIPKEPPPPHHERRS